MVFNNVSLIITTIIFEEFAHRKIIPNWPKLIYKFFSALLQTQNDTK